MARPKLEISDEKRKQIRGLSALGLAHEDIATIVSLDRRTMERRCKLELEQGRSEMRGRLHKIQFGLAGKSAAMAIWLGKQYLGQRDHPIAESEKGTIVEYVQRVITTTKAEPAPADGGDQPPTPSGEVR